MTVITTWFEEHCAGILNGSSTLYALKIAVGTGDAVESQSDSALETELVSGPFVRATATTTYSTVTHTLTVTKTFTNSGTTVLYIREAGIFSDTSLAARYVIPDNIYVIPGQTIIITFYLQFIPGARDTTEYNLGRQTLQTCRLYIYPTCAAALGSTDAIPCAERACFSGIKLPNPVISPISQYLGAKGWDISCYTEDYSYITQLEMFCAPIEVQNNVKGYQIINSLVVPGTLRIQQTYNTWDIYTNCYISPPITITPYGEGWWYSLKILQSFR